jgi:iron complex transport system substrate-binding protein
MIIVLQKINAWMAKWRSIFLGLLAFLLVVFSSGACTPNTVTQSSTPSPTAECRMVQHSVGETCVPLNPQRVVVLDNLDGVLAMGVTPIAYLGSADPFLMSYLDDTEEPVETIGLTETGPNLEAIVRLKPDLILGMTWHTGAGMYQPLSQIAPTVLVDVDSDGQWKAPLTKFAEALGKTAEAEKILADYNARLAEFKAAMGDRLDQLTVSILRVYPDALAFYLKNSFPGSILEDAGLKRPPAQAIERTGQNQQRIDKELLPTLEADVMFVWTYGHTKEIAQNAQTALSQLKTNPLWLALDVVQRNQVYDVSSFHWLGFGPIAANLVLDDLFKHLVEGFQS